MRMNACCIFPVVLFSSVAFPQSSAELIEAGHFKRARPLVEARLKSNANDAQANFEMGRIRRATGDNDSAFTYAEKAVELDGGKAPYHAFLAEVTADAAQHASMLKAMGMVKTMRKELDAALALDPKNIEALTIYMMFYLKAPAMLGGDKNKAELMADDAVRANAVRGYLVKSRLASEEKATDRAEAMLRKAVEADPKHYGARVTLANFLAGPAQMKFEEAERCAREAVKLDPGRATGYAVLANVYAAQKKWPELDTILKDAEKNVPDNYVPYYRAGRALLANGDDLPRAEAYFRKYLSQEPEGNEPQLPFAHWSLGLVLEKLDRKAAAVSEMELCVKAKPDFELAKKDLARIKQ